MAFSQPVLRQEKRQALPESISGREKGSIGIGAGLKSHGMSNFPKAGINAHPGGMGISSGIKPIAKLAGGGIVRHFDGGGSIDPSYMNDNGNDPYMQSGAFSANDPTVKFNPDTAGLNLADPSQMAQQQMGGMPNQNQLGSHAYDSSSGAASSPTNTGGQTAMSASSGVLLSMLANISAGQLQKSAAKQNAAAANIPTRSTNPSMGRVAVRGHASGGLIQSYASGGIHGDMFAQGGMEVPNSGNPGTNDGGLSSPPQQSATPSTMPQQPHQDSPISQALAGKAIHALLGQSQNPQKDIQDFISHFGQEAFQVLVKTVEHAKGGQDAPGQLNPSGGIVGPQQQPTGASQPAQTPGMAPPQGQGMASGGITGSRDENGLLSGDGGGMDDQIHSNGSQVRVADSEFVIPADAVSQLGDGSTKEGARKLTQGIANLRQQKYGHTKQPKKLGPNKNPILGN